MIRALWRYFLVVLALIDEYVGRTPAILVGGAVLLVVGGGVVVGVSVAIAYVVTALSKLPAWIQLVLLGTVLFVGLSFLAGTLLQNRVPVRSDGGGLSQRYERRWLWEDALDDEEGEA